VPIRRALSAAYSRSSSTASWPGKPIVKVAGGSAERRAIAATTAAESTPPDRKAPYGTSDIICRSTASAKRSASCVASSSSAIPSKWAPGGSRQLSTRGVAPSSATSVAAGGNLAIPSNSVRGEGTKRQAR
jgi:hypothetical protein